MVEIFCALQTPRKGENLGFLSVVAKKSRLNVDPIPAETSEKDIAVSFKLDRALVARLKDVLYNESRR